MNDLNNDLPVERFSHSLFEEPWWLEAVAPNAWGAVEINGGGSIQARLPYVIGKKFGCRTIQQPLLTQTLGPWYRNTGGKACSVLSREKDLANELIAGLPKHDFFSMNFHHSVQNWLPFFWKGFTATPRITYILDDLTDEAVLWSGLQENIRREIRKAKKVVEVTESDDLDQFQILHRMTFERQSLPSPNYGVVLRRLDDACKRRDARRIYLAKDEQGQFHAGLYVVFDERCAYYLMGGGDPQLRSSGATSLLMWTAIQAASKTSKVFDFEGSMGEHIERFFRAFGSRQAPYLNIRGHNRWSGSAECLRQALRTLTKKS